LKERRGTKKGMGRKKRGEYNSAGRTRTDIYRARYYQGEKRNWNGSIRKNGKKKVLPQPVATLSSSIFGTEEKGARRGSTDTE